jgi:hypothetical protein
MLFCNIPYGANNGQEATNTSTNLARIFRILNQKKEEKMIETYSLTQTSLEQIFVQLAGEDDHRHVDITRFIALAIQSIAVTQF